MTNKQDSTIDDAFETARKNHEIYAKDNLNVTPIHYFLEAFGKFYEFLVADVYSERFAESRKFFDAFAQQCGNLEYNEGLSDVWRQWEQGVRAVDHYDAAEKARLTPPAKTIDELIANGVSETVIAKIYGFYDANGKPDVVAVRERRPWAPAPKKVSPALQRMIDMVQAKRNEAELRGEEVPQPPQRPVVEEKKDAPKSKPAKSSKQLETEIKANIKTKLDADIEAGVAPRQIAAKYGCTVEDVRTRAEEIAAGKNGSETTTTAKKDDGK